MAYRVTLFVDVAVPLTSAADMIPCGERVQEKGLKVINATWPGRGLDLAKACWASFDIMAVSNDWVRPQNAHGPGA